MKSCPNCRAKLYETGVGIKHCKFCGYANIPESIRKKSPQETIL